MDRKTDKYICVTDGFSINAPEKNRRVSVIRGDIVDINENGYLIKNNVSLCHSESILGHYHFQKNSKNQKSDSGNMEKRKYTIYACDFDGTLCESVYPGIGAPNMSLIIHLRKRREQGNKVILWTCRCGERLSEAVNWCRAYGLEFDAVNENLPKMIEWYGNNPRKIFADVYIDDKAVNKPKYHVPYREDCRYERT